MNTRDHFSKVATHYNKLATNGLYATLAPHNKGGRKSEYINAVFDAAVLDRLPLRSTGRILDFGCGTGSLTRILADRFAQVWGVDISPGMLTTAKQYCRKTANTGLAHINGLTLPFDNDSFDFVVARESLCYMPDEQLSTALGEIHRVLKPDGRFLWLEQVSDSPRWQRHLSAPNLVKRPLSLLYLKLKLAGFHVQYSAVVRSPRFPWIYPVWFGLLPKRSIPKLAALEVAWHRRFNTLTKRWWNQLIVAEKKSTSNPHETTKSQ